ncbi:MAG TPA: hypothetical protein VGM23_12785, partial [Armatimonadota bacterium]
MPSMHDRDIIQRLAAETAEIAALPVQEETRRMWRKLNGLTPERPMVMIDQVCWNEMNVDDELTLACEDEECRRFEDLLRRQLYQWRHFRLDMVIEPFIRVPMAIQNAGFGLSAKAHMAESDSDGIIGRSFDNQ